MAVNFRLAYTNGIQYTDLFPKTTVDAITATNIFYTTQLVVPATTDMVQTIPVETSDEMLQSVFRVYLVSTGTQAEQDYSTITQAQIVSGGLEITRLYDKPQDSITIQLVFYGNVDQ